MNITLRDLKLNQRAIRAWLATKPADEKLANPSSHRACVIVQFVDEVAGKTVSCGYDEVTLRPTYQHIQLPDYLMRWQDIMMVAAGNRLDESGSYEDHYVTGAEARRAFREATR